LRDALLEDGAIIVEDLLDRAALAALNRDLDPLLADADPAMRHLNPTLDAFFGQRVRHISGLAGKSMAFAEQVMCHPTYLGLCDAVLLPHCADYQLNLGHLMDRGPGAEAQWVHRDEDVWIHCPRPHPELLLASILALVDFHRDNGATFVVPGSHRWERERQPAGEEIAFAEMKAGSAVIYLGSVLHGGGTNCTQSEWRRGVHISYAQGWLRTEENNVLAVPPETARNLSPRAQRLLGYGVHDAIADEGGYLGMVDMRNPMELLASGEL
ncbi:MAG: phytanoyl-CoA dioxygenase family protein, partial [Spongiibacteraceae bacterium]|nr:phytanoyl-CoA dioxygenase family protein [Spongiibacteraceae bacterium]